MQLQSFFQFHDPQYKHIIKYISIRWLSLEAAVGRALRLLPLLTSYFLSEEDKSPQLERLGAFIKGWPFKKSHTRSLVIVLPVFIIGFNEAQSVTTKRRPLDLPCSRSQD